jgi:ribosomal protein S18 acetylase RimI-like enzyme
MMWDMKTARLDAATGSDRADDMAITLPATVRSFHRDDQAACGILYLEGLLGGKIAENDTGLDIEDIEQAYLRSTGNHFWVAESATREIVGMIGVQQQGDGAGEIRRLRLRPDYRERHIGRGLVEAALKFCQEQSYLKVTLDTFLRRDLAISLFEKFHFHHDHTRNYNGKDLLYFYLDLYETDGRPPRQ